MEEGGIDFVLMWVDGSDPEWRALKDRYDTERKRAAPGDADANGECRYRDYGMLRYWFRAVERFAPWVGRVFFVTCGQKPDWLAESNPKLRLVNHADFIPAEYLPTFQANTIEMNLHRIKDLSERFVLFNDDMFLLRPVDPGLFFRNGLPVIPCDLAVPRWIGCSNTSRLVLNDAGVLKMSMDVEAQVRKNIWKFIDVRSLGLARAAKNLASFLVNRLYIPGTFGHLPLAHLKSTLEEIWRRQPEVLDRTSRHKFRTDDCVNQWLVSAWDMISGRFRPANEKRMGRYMALCEENLDEACETVRRQKYLQLCLNDKSATKDPDYCFEQVAKAFGEILPDKSSFEKP